MHNASNPPAHSFSFMAVAHLLGAHRRTRESGPIVTR
jgi:hypothetical protein